MSEFHEGDILPPFIINQNSEQIDQPKHISIPLKPHQSAMIFAMNNLEQKRYIEVCDIHPDNVSLFKQWFQTDMGCLCDKVGSGKSLTILGLIAHKPLLKQRRMCIKSFGFNMRTYDVMKYNLPFNIITVPHGIISQWVKYITEFTSLRYNIINNKKTLSDFEVKVEHYIQQQNNIEEDFDYDILLVSSSMYNKVASKLNNIRINRLIIDEVDSIRVPQSAYISSEFLWFITSSKDLIQNPQGRTTWEPVTYTDIHGNERQYTARFNRERMPHSGYFKNTLANIESIQFKSQIFLQCEEQFVKHSFEIPEIKEIIIECKDTIYTAVLHGIVSQEVMSMINAGDISGAIESSGFDTDSEEGLIKNLTKNLESKLNNKKIELNAKQQMTYSTLLAKETALKKIKEDIKELEDKIKCIKTRTLETEACPVCCDVIHNRIIVKCCNNPFCLECITMCINHKPNCPLCRKAITQKDIIVLKNKTNEAEKEEEKTEEQDSDRSKLQNLKKYVDKLMAKEKKRKLLIFSEYENSFGDIENYLKEKGYKYSKLKGQTTVINRIVNDYKNDKIDILLLNSKYFGSGLNLENTTDLFMLHKMNKSIDKQVIGRAQRPGRSKRLRVYRLVHKNEISV